MEDNNGIGSKTASVKIGVGNNANAGGGMSGENSALLGSSYTDQRQAEQDYFRDIIDRTAQNFIDVSSVPVAIDKKDASDRTKEYLQLLAQAPATSVASLNKLYSLTTNNNSMNSTAAMLSEETRLTTNDVEMIGKSLENVVAVSQFKVKDCGDIIIPFTDMSS